jgi:IBR domain, a half RING-finger domain
MRPGDIVTLDCGHLMCQTCGRNKLNFEYNRRSLDLKCHVCNVSSGNRCKEQILGRDIFAMMAKEVSEANQFGGYKGSYGFGMQASSASVLTCSFGREPLFTDYVFFNCCHASCVKCGSNALRKLFEEQRTLQLKCRVCQMDLEEDDKVQLVPKKELEAMQEELMEESYNIVKCYNCENKFEFNPGKVEKMPDMTLEQAKCFAENRFKCPKCGTEQCRRCKKEKEFHRGMTCEEFQNKKKSM